MASTYSPLTTHIQPSAGSPETFGRYRLLAPLASGGMAEVFVAELQGPRGFRRRVALKRVLPHLAADPIYQRAFEDEARVCGLLIHPNIVQILDFDLVAGVPYLAMEFVEGGHFGTLISRARRLKSLLPLSAVVTLFLEVARGVRFAHEARDNRGRPLNLIHRDLKPSNLLLSSGGQVKIADFGIAKASTNLVQTMPQVVKGSLPYMSPEQARGEPEIDAASDLFSLGAVLYELLVTERLFRADSPVGVIEQVTRGPSKVRLARLDLLPGEYRWLAPVVRKLVATEPGERYSGALALIQAIEALGILELSPEELAAFAREWLTGEQVTRQLDRDPSSPADRRMERLNGRLEEQPVPGASLAETLAAQLAATLAAQAEETFATPVEDAVATPVETRVEQTFATPGEETLRTPRSPDPRMVAGGLEEEDFDLDFVWDESEGGLETPGEAGQDELEPTGPPPPSAAEETPPSGPIAPVITKPSRPIAAVIAAPTEASPPIEAVVTEPPRQMEAVIAAPTEASPPIEAVVTEPSRPIAPVITEPARPIAAETAEPSRPFVVEEPEPARPLPPPGLDRLRPSPEAARGAPRLTPVQKTAPAGLPAPSERRSSQHRRLAAMLIGMGIVGGALVGWSLRGDQPAQQAALSPIGIARLSILSEPPGSEVRLPGGPVGRTPLRLEVSTAGDIHLELKEPAGSMRIWDGRLGAGERRVVDFPKAGVPISWLETARATDPGANREVR